MIDENELHAFINIAENIIKDEYKQMPKICECGGTLEFTSQALLAYPVRGDLLTYVCNICEKPVERFFPFPETYAKLWENNEEIDK